MNKINKQAILYVLFCICFCSCEKEELQEKTKQSYIQLSMPESIHVDTKSDDSDPKLGEILISNVWIVQFNAQSNLCTKALYVPKAQIKPSSVDQENGVIVNLTTGGTNGDQTKFSDTDSRFYIIANGGISLLATQTSDANIMYELPKEELDKLTEVVLKAKTISVGTDIENPLVTEELSLLTSGPVAYKPEEDGVIKVRTQMFRAFARIKLTISFVGSKGKFNLTGSNIYNLPKEMAMYRAAGLTTTTYPEATVGTNNGSEKFRIAKGPFDLGIQDLNSGTGSTTKTFYMAENLRGVGKSTTQQGKNKKENGPASTETDPLVGCTYIELEGVYRYDADHTDGIKVKYTFYLGGNFTNDYNIARDYSYELTLKIAGPNSADLRVMITDGNLAVFDEVDRVDNIVVDF